MARRSPTRIPGRLQVHRDGYAFLIASRDLPGVVGDVFVPPDALGTAMNGDRVLVSLVRLGRDGRAEGRVAKILDRAHPTVVGTFHVKPRRNYVEPFDGRLQDWIEIPAGHEIPPSGLEEDRIGAMSAAILAISKRSGLELERGEIHRVLIDGGEGYLAINSIGNDAVLVALVDKNVRLGMLFYECRKCVEELKKII